ncbi:MAG: GWxTD domain-containing protein, partial [candidate division KSB1 bacterium]|nr:GWxTD domain-containing protein [candidate division KSB1 bacterium]
QVLPNPSRQYGLLHPKVGIYFEIYNLQYKPENRFNSFSVVYTLKNTHNDLIDVLSQSYQKPGASAVVSLTIPAEKLPTGTYSLSIEVCDDDTKEKSCLSGQFSVWQSPIFLKFKNYNQAVEELSYIASPEEIKHLKSLPTEKQQQALVDFWRARDPSSGTEENELMNEYYLRLEYANQVFKTGKQQGWKTDRGRIYVRYGQPDCIIHNPYQIPSKSFEVWEYEPQNLRFIFVDETGFGEYRLLSPQSYSQFLPWY